MLSKETEKPIEVVPEAIKLNRGDSGCLGLARLLFSNDNRFKRRMQIGFGNINARFDDLITTLKTLGLGKKERHTSRMKSATNLSLDQFTQIPVVSITTGQDKQPQPERKKSINVIECQYEQEPFDDKDVLFEPHGG
ncbi:hypothetical protein POTOM_060017 [Populus tomentosa]|uniref:Uncharacterized protein n=1 Tax=Populus tomentosa TaxID=118781 RepID=A0A8X7XRF0_POPTO|nr:hypothetical protein POTOM_060017 [Populus tomentosa]